MQIEAFFGRHHDAWRVYVRGWTPPMLARHLDEHREAFPVAFDADELETYMWKCDAPYDKKPTTLGGLQVSARGRAAVMLLVFLEDVAARLEPDVRRYYSTHYPLALPALLLRVIERKRKRRATPALNREASNRLPRQLGQKPRLCGAPHSRGYAV